MHQHCACVCSLSLSILYISFFAQLANLACYDFFSPFKILQDDFFSFLVQREMHAKHVGIEDTVLNLRGAEVRMSNPRQSVVQLVFLTT